MLNPPVGAASAAMLLKPLWEPLQRRCSSAGKSIRRRHQLPHDPRLERRMPRILHDPQFGLGEGAMQIPRATHGTHHVVTALHDNGRDMTDLVDVTKQLTIDLEETRVDEVVAF